MMKRSSSGVKRKIMLATSALMQTLLPLPVVPATSTGEIAFQRDDFVHPHAFRRINFVARDRRPFRDIAGRHRNPELAERIDKHALDLFELGWIDRGPAFGVVHIELVESRQGVI